MAAFGDDSLFFRLKHGAALFRNMAASGEFALHYIRLKFTETILKRVLADDLHALHFNGGKAGGIRHKAAALQSKKLRVAGGMPPSAEFLNSS